VDNAERLADARALEDIRTTPGWLALERLIQRMRVDAVESLASDGAVSRKETKGKLQALDGIILAVDNEIEFGRESDREAEETLDIRRGKPLEGGGTGDLT
jgi:hypothetical protein